MILTGCVKFGGLKNWLLPDQYNKGGSSCYNCALTPIPVVYSFRKKYMAILRNMFIYMEITQKYGVNTVLQCFLQCVHETYTVKYVAQQKWTIVFEEQPLIEGIILRFRHYCSVFINLEMIALSHN